MERWSTGWRKSQPNSTASELSLLQESAIDIPPQPSKMMSEAVVRWLLLINARVMTDWIANKRPTFQTDRHLACSVVRRSSPDNTESHVCVGGDQSVIDTPFGDNACDLGQLDN
jgi:hypothetical protein